MSVKRHSESFVSLLADVTGPAAVAVHAPVAPPFPSPRPFRLRNYDPAAGRSSTAPATSGASPAPCCTS